MEVASACLAYGGLREDGSEEGGPSARAWWVGGSYREALEEEREKILSGCDTC